MLLGSHELLLGKTDGREGWGECNSSNVAMFWSRERVDEQHGAEMPLVIAEQGWGK